MTQIAVFGSGSISQRHRSTDPDLYQNVMDPQPWFSGYLYSNWFCVGCIVLVVLTSKDCLHRIPCHGHHGDIFADQLTGNESGLTRSPPLGVNLQLQGHLVLVLRELLHTL
jgi:hypothetical protein